MTARLSLYYGTLALKVLLRSFARMYRPHAANEETSLGLGDLERFTP